MTAYLHLQNQVARAVCTRDFWLASFNIHFPIHFTRRAHEYPITKSVGGAGWHCSSTPFSRAGVMAMASLDIEASPYAECRTLRKYHSDLVTAIQNPLRLANVLYSKDFVSENIIQRLTGIPATKDENVTILLGAVSDHISVCPEKFEELLTILGQEPPLMSLVEEMRRVTMKRTHSSKSIGF